MNWKNAALTPSNPVTWTRDGSSTPFRNTLKRGETLNFPVTSVADWAAVGREVSRDRPARPSAVTLLIVERMLAVKSPQSLAHQRLAAVRCSEKGLPGPAARLLLVERGSQAERSRVWLVH